MTPLPRSLLCPSPCPLPLRMQPRVFPQVVILTRDISLKEVMEIASATNSSHGNLPQSRSSSNSPDAASSSSNDLPGVALPTSYYLLWQGPFSQDPTFPQTAALDFGGLSDVLMFVAGTRTLFLQRLVRPGPGPRCAAACVPGLASLHISAHTLLLIASMQSTVAACSCMKCMAFSRAAHVASCAVP